MRLSKKESKILEQYFAGEDDINAAYVFGSYGTEKETPLSDIDFAVLFAEDVEVDLQREMAVMAQKISLLLRKEEIDLVNLNKAPVIIQHQVIKNGDLIYENDEQVLIEFVKKVLTFFYDEKIRSERFYKIYEAALKEEYEDER